MKKFISMMLASVMVTAFTVVPANAQTEDTDNGYVLLYENDFEDGSVGQKYVFEAADSEYFLFTPLENTGNTGAEQVVTVEKDGNKGIAKSSKGAYTKGRTIWFDFTKGVPGSGGVTPEGSNPYISTGFVKISFDFSVNGSTSGNTETRIGYNMNRKYNEAGIGQRMIIIGGAECLLLDKLQDSWSGGTKTALEVGKVYEMAMVMDFNSGKVYYYLDGALLKTHTNLEALKDFSIGINGDLEYLDNLKIEKYDSLPLSAEMKASQGEIFVKFSDALLNEDALKNGAVLKNVYTGEETTVSLTLVNAMTAKVEIGEGFSYNAEYIITLPEGIEGISGGVLENLEYRFSPLTDGALTGVKLKDVWGNEYFLKDSNMAELQSLIFEFTDDVDAKTVISGLSITDGAEECEYTAVFNNNTAEVKLLECLTGNTDYKILVPEDGGLLDAYEINLKTAEGKTAIKSVKWFVGDKEIFESSELKDGDKVDIKVEFINSTNKAVSFISTASLFNGLDMNGFTFAKTEFEDGQKSAENVLSLTVENAENAVIKTFARKGINMTMPLFGEGILD